MKKIILLSTLLFAILSGVHATELIQQPDPKVIQRFEWRMFPKPESVKKKGGKVIVVFDRKEWEAFHYMHRKMWLRRGEVNKRVMELREKEKHAGKPR